MQQQLFKGRDKRNKGWFWMDNDYLNGYAKIFGAVGTAIYVSLCRHADNETQKCFPAMDLMGKELGVSRNTISKYLKLFEKHHLIRVEKERDNKTKKWLNNVYTLLDKEEWDSHAQIVSMDNPCTIDNKSHAQQVGNKETNINKTNIILHTEADASGKEINDIIKLFINVNPSYEQLFKRNNQRDAIKRLLKNLGREKLETAIKYIEIANTMPFAPTITTPLQLEEKIGQLRSFIIKQNVKLQNKKPTIAKIK